IRLFLVPETFRRDVLIPSGPVLRGVMLWAVLFITVSPQKWSVASQMDYHSSPVLCGPNHLTYRASMLVEALVMARFAISETSTLNGAGPDLMQDSGLFPVM